MGKTRIVIWVADHMVVISFSCLPTFLSNLGKVQELIQKGAMGGNNGTERRYRRKNR